VGGRSERAIRRAATLGDGFMPYMYTPAQYAAARLRLEHEAAAVGRDPMALAKLLHQFIYVADNDAEAQQILAARLQQVYQQPFTHLVEKYCTAGTPETCRASLQAYVDAGVRTFILAPPVMSAAEFRQQLGIYAREILPALRTTQGRSLDMPTGRG
jgi:alkanesulfonate monooxygenase SsuD/methylene tetrahydromethanopterin reductase-like flavin-dependent oxidoreductase (luciferase family)